MPTNNERLNRRGLGQSRNYRGGGVFLPLLVALLLPLAGCKPPGSGDHEGRSSEGPVTVRETQPFLTSVLARRITRTDISATIAATGTVVPTRSRMVKAEEAGRLYFAREWQEGDFVEAGTLIARVESDSLTSDLETSRADLRLAHESLDIARKSRDARVREYESIQDLFVRGIAPRREVDSAELQMQQAINSYRREEISLEKARERLRSVELRTERLEIRAPFDGLLVARTTIDGTKPFTATFGTETIADFEGRLVSADFAVCGIIDTSQVLIRCDVTSRDIDKVVPGQTAEALVYTGRELEVTGSVIDISRALKQETGAFEVDILVDNPDRILRPGMYARANIVTETRYRTISIPKEIITRRNNMDVVFVAEKAPDMEYYVAREAPIETGLASRDTIEVTWGLKEGDSVIIRGFEILQDQTPINVVYPDDPIRPADRDDAATTGTLVRERIDTQSS